MISISSQQECNQIDSMSPQSDNTTLQCWCLFSGEYTTTILQISYAWPNLQWKNFHINCSEVNIVVKLIRTLDSLSISTFVINNIEISSSTIKDSTQPFVHRGLNPGNSQGGRGYCIFLTLYIIFKSQCIEFQFFANISIFSCVSNSMN